MRSPDGGRLASASDDQTVKVWDAAAGKELLTMSGHSKGVESVALSPDAKRLATADLDVTARMRDATTGKELLTLSGRVKVTASRRVKDGKRLSNRNWNLPDLRFC